MKRYTHRLSLLTCFIALALGCSEGAKTTPLPLEEIPQNLMEVAQNELPDVKFEQAIKRGDGSIEIRGKDSNGKVRDIDFSATGEILEVE
ncbi:MAG: hypothetical protein KDB23_02040 [Planctomycetales bacterium]|nr:hypothetical protein [Planctomycetales bacterium]